MSTNDKPLNLSARREKIKFDISIRDVVQDDIAFIFNSWLRSHRQGRLCAKVDNAIYFAEQHKLIEKLIKRGKVKLAVDPKEPGNILAYLVYEYVQGIFVIHYVYTKHTFRNMGIAKQLMLNTGHNFETASCMTHLTPVAEKLQNKFNMVYHPYILVNYHNDTVELNPDVAEPEAVEGER